MACSASCPPPCPYIVLPAPAPRVCRLLPLSGNGRQQAHFFFRQLRPDIIIGAFHHPAHHLQRPPALLALPDRPPPPRPSAELHQQPLPPPPLRVEMLEV